MDVESIRRYCLSFQGATEKLQWGDALCFKIREKIFAIVSLDEPGLCFKCTEQQFNELIELEDIRPAPYVGRYKWVLLERMDALGEREITDLIAKSYAMVLAKTPKSAVKGQGKQAKKGARKRSR